MEDKLKVVNQLRRDLGMPPLSALGARDPRAVPKLDFKEQCEILAFCLCGVPVNLIATAFDVSQRSVFRIKSGNHYSKVVTELMSCGSSAEFCDKYITEEKEEWIHSVCPAYKRIEKNG